MSWSSLTKRGASAGSKRTRESAATSRTTLSSIGMAQLRERGQDLLRARAAELHRELGAVAHALAGHDHALPELGVDHAHADGAGRAAARSRRGPLLVAAAAADHGLGLHPGSLLVFQAIVRDLRQEARHPAPHGVPRATEVGVEEMHAALRARERDVEEPPLLLELRRILERGGMGKQ